VTIRSEDRRSGKLVKDATKKLFSDGIKKLVKRWNRWVEIEGNYFEK
jgi:hypothetical protein